ncbi:Two-component response regulator SSK1p [Mucor circinelloides]
MFEPEAAPQKAPQLSDKAQDAFMKATAAAPLPTFSLPSNLNDKLVTNKQKAATNTTSTAARPRLSNLRSTWLSQQSFEEDAFADDKIIDIRLPSISTAKVKYTSVLREISVLATVATLLCLFSATYLALKPNASSFYSLLLGGWILLLVWFMLDDCRSDNIVCSLVYFRYSAIVMLVVTGWSHNETALPLLIACVLFYVGERLSIAHKQLQAEMVQLQTDQQTATQQAIDRALDDYNDKRTLFMSTVSQEIRDAALMVIATLEQFSPSSILSNTHELLSACSIAVPIASISAINTTIKQACHISSHLNLVARMLRDSESLDDIPEQERVKSNVSQDFDVGELLQNVGDALAGMSAKLGVHFVVFHTDNGLYYPNVIGDEDAIKHALINLLRNLLEGCTPGACIELGLYVASIPETPKVKVTFDIVQIASPAIPVGLSRALIPNANFTARLLDYIGGKMELEDLGKNKTRVEVSLELYPGCNSDQKLLLIEKPSQILEKQLSNIRFSNEPTLEDLSMFINNLKGVKIILYAPERSIFAKHLTSCLTSWNTDISHLPVLMAYKGDDEEALQQSDTMVGSDSEASSVCSLQQQQAIKTPLETIQANLSPASNRSITSDISKKVPSPAIEEDHIHSIPPTFILIDDDIMTLEKKLREFRDKPIVPVAEKHHHPSQSRRHRRSKSRQGGTAEGLSAYGTVAVVFFTSLTNYKRVRDTIHWFSSLSQAPYLPRVVVVPKPAGPRRFLTALHTAWINAIVEPQFIPIATSPLSPFVPGIGSMNCFHHPPNHYSPVDPGSNSTTGTNNAMTPGIGAQPPLMTPHDMNRFSPGRRTVSTARGLHSPSNLQMEAEKTNYFFDPSRPSGPNVPAKLNTSPLLTAVNNNMISSPINMPANNPPLPAPGSANGTTGSISSNSSAGSNATPSEIKRRLRSHSSTFMAPTGRRTLVDLSLSPTSSPHGIAGNTTSSPVKEATEQEEQDAVDAAAAASPPLNIASPSSILKSMENHSTSSNEDSSRQSSMESPVLPTHAQILASRSNVDNNVSVVDPLKAIKATLSPPLAPPPPAPATAATASSSAAAATNESTAPTLSSPLSATSTPAASNATTAASTPISAATPPPTSAAIKPKSKFNFKISNRKRKEKTSSSGKQSPPITVLIVEDNMINQAILSTWMKKHSIKFSVASDGKEAVEKWKGGGFHLILMDIQLPVMDGIAATKMIRSIEKERKIGVLPSSSTFLADHDMSATEAANSTIVEEEPTKEKEKEEEEEEEEDKTKKESPTPSASSSSNVSSFQSPVIIVALTASSLESDRQAALAAGCNDFLTKPVSLEWLEKKIMEWGCMQALIDFEGWRKWKRSAASSKSAKSSNPAAIAEASKQAAFAATAAATAATKTGLAAQIMTKEETEAIAHEKEMLALRTKEMLKDESKGIILVGIHKRRMSTAVTSSNSSLFDDRSIVITRADSSSRSSTPPLQQQPPLSASPTRTTFHHFGHHRLRKRASDPDMYTHEMSIPKQVEAREHKRILEQQRLLQQWEHEQEEDDSSSHSSE